MKDRDKALSEQDEQAYKSALWANRDRIWSNRDTWLSALEYERARIWGLEVQQRASQIVQSLD